MKKILKLLVMLLLLQITLVSCEDDEKDSKTVTIRFDYFRDICKFSNSLYNEKAFEKSPYHDVKRQISTQTDHDGTYQTDEIFDNGRFIKGTSIDNGATYKYSFSWSGTKYTAFGNEGNKTGHGEVNDKGLYVNQIWISSSGNDVAYHRYDGWNRIEYNYSSDTNKTIKYCTFDGKFLKTINNISEFTSYYEERFEFTNDGNHIISSKNYTRYDKEDDLEMRSETTYQYDSNDNVIKAIEHSLITDEYDIKVLTWKDNLPVDIKSYTRCDTASSYTIDDLSTIEKYSWSNKRLIKYTLSSYDNESRKYTVQEQKSYKYE